MIKLPRRLGRVPLVVLFMAQTRILVGGQAVHLPLIPLVADAIA